MDETVISNFHSLKVRQDVAAFLGVSDKQLRYVLYGIKSFQRYRQFNIPKGNDKYRLIETPVDELMFIQRILLQKLKSVYRPKPSSYGFINGKNHILNAQQHTRNKQVLNVDLKDFFHQIHFGRVRGMFIHEPYAIGEEAATVIAQLVCHNGRLPQGAPTSPIISNMICAPLDTQLTHLAKKYHINYTRYADDITFSSHQNHFPKEIAEKNGEVVTIGNELKEIIAKNSFVINEDKVFLNSENHRQEVTGLIINEFVNVKREYIREIRTLLHSCRTKGIVESAIKYSSTKKELEDKIKKIKDKAITKEEAELAIEDWFAQVLHGKINYLADVRGHVCGYYLKYAKAYNSIFSSFHFDLEKASSPYRDWCYVIEGSSTQGSGFLLRGYGIITSYHVVNKPEDFYDVKTERKKVTRIVDVTEYNKELDYALYPFNLNSGWEKGNSDSIQRGTGVTLVGFPNYTYGNNATILQCVVTNEAISFKQKIWAVDKPIIHGMSGGVVLDKNSKAIGIIKAGVNSMDESDKVVSGFIPINTIIDDIEFKRNKTL